MMTAKRVDRPTICSVSKIAGMNCFLSASFSSHVASPLPAGRTASA